MAQDPWPRLGCSIGAVDSVKPGCDVVGTLAEKHAKTFLARGTGTADHTRSPPEQPTKRKLQPLQRLSNLSTDGAPVDMYDWLHDGTTH
jgi:hypothetical protein